MKASERMEHERRRKAFSKIKPLLEPGEVPILLIARPLPGEVEARGVSTRCILGDDGRTYFDEHYAIAALYQAFSEFVQPKLPDHSDEADEASAEFEAETAQALLMRARSFSMMGAKQLLIEDARAGPGNGHAGMQVMMLQGAVEGARLTIEPGAMAAYLRAMAAWLEGGAPEDREHELVIALAEATRAAVAADHDFIERAAQAKDIATASTQGSA